MRHSYSETNNYFSTGNYQFADAQNQFLKKTWCISQFAQPYILQWIRSSNQSITFVQSGKTNPFNCEFRISWWCLQINCSELMSSSPGSMRNRAWWWLSFSPNNKINPPQQTQASANKSKRLLILVESHL